MYNHYPLPLFQLLFLTKIPLQQAFKHLAVPCFVMRLVNTNRLFSNVVSLGQ